MTELRVAVLMTCHNRADRTLQCLQSLFEQDAADTSLEPVLVDAGSTDGTSQLVTASFPQVNVVQRGSELFWNGGMREAYAHAYLTDPDFYLWLNDDVTLDRDAVDRLLASHARLRSSRSAPSIVAGSTRDPDTKDLSYGGVVRPVALRPLHYELVIPGDVPIRVETMNGNCVLVPRDVVARIGTLASAYTHGMGDYDYGHRASRAGCEVWIAPDTIGTCARNPKISRAASLQDHRRRATGPTTGLPPREWFTFARRWAGPIWPIYAVSPYIRRFVRWMVQR